MAEMDRRSFLVRAGAAVAVSAVPQFRGAAAAASVGGRREYVIRRGGIDVYNIDAGHVLAKSIAVSSIVNARGACVGVPAGKLFVSFGGDGNTGSGSMLRYDLASDTVDWTRTYSIGIDSMAITPDGSTIYLPDGEASSSNLWYVVDAATGAVTGQIAAGTAPHNTVVSLDGGHVYLGGRRTRYLEVASTATNKVVAKIGPLFSSVRPFTITGRQTLAYTTATKLFGFEVSSITTSKRLFTVGIPGFTWNGSTPPTCPCHGISLSPDESEVWLIDHPNRYVHVFDTTPLPTSPPVLVASIPVSGLSGLESGCTHDCQREGWLHHSLDGQYVYVGDSGDVIDTSTRTVVANLSTLRDSRIHLEITFDSAGATTDTSTRHGLGRVTG
jgi:YVTN family beta-propeller protein